MVIKSRNCLSKTQRRQKLQDNTRNDLIVVGALLDPDLQASQLRRDVEAGADVIDLGAPRRVRASVAPRQPRPPRLYTPNPRLYPGFSKKREKTGPVRKHTFTRSAPNSRPPWPALPPASHAALRLLRARSVRHATLTYTARGSAASPGACAMAAGKYSTSPDCSDGNDASSAPSEFLAEFLSAIMRRQYAEALKYCQLILQYEPHNATAQGFYPLLRHKLHAQPKDETSSSEDTSSKRGGLFNVQFRQKTDAPTKAETEEDDVEEEGCEVEMSQSSSGSGSGSLCSSLELDSSSPPSPRLARPVPDDTTEPSDPTDPSDSSWRWESGGDGGDDNGNPVLHLASGSAAESAASATNANVADADNNTASQEQFAQAKMHSETETESPLRRLRAQFACSIK